VHQATPGDEPPVGVLQLVQVLVFEKLHGRTLLSGVRGGIYRFYPAAKTCRVGLRTSRIACFRRRIRAEHSQEEAVHNLSPGCRG
jgi:hypothetical protein